MKFFTTILIFLCANTCYSTPSNCLTWANTIAVLGNLVPNGKTYTIEGNEWNYYGKKSMGPHGFFTIIVPFITFYRVCFPIWDEITQHGNCICPGQTIRRR